jgi:hypothetical protein
MILLYCYIYKLISTGITREPGEHRIGFLAKIRNIVLEPMLQQNTTTYEQVVYFNDVYICATAVLQLMQQVHVAGDMVCGADYILHKSSNRLFYYDTWATIDMSGRHFQNAKPYILDGDSWQRFANYQPIQVLSCWGGTAVLKADIFQKDRVRFRRSMELECPTSECELLPRDLWSLGRHKIAIVSTARTAYDWESFEFAQNELREAHLSAFDPLTKFQQVPPSSVMCCGLDDVENEVDFRHCVQEPFLWWHRAFGTPLSLTASGLEALLDPEPPIQRKPFALTINDLSAYASKGVLCNELPQKLIPRRIVQTWTTKDFTKLPSQFALGVVSWISMHPCYHYELLDDTDVSNYIKSSWSNYFLEFESLDLINRLNLFRYLYLMEHGGIYADIDTVAMQSIEGLIQLQDKFVVGTEFEFEHADHAKYWMTVKVRGASLHCFASMPQSPVLTSLIDTALARIRVPATVYSEMRKLGSGYPMLTETQFLTGAVVFSDVVFAAVVNNEVRLLGLFELSGPRDEGGIFYRDIVRRLLPQLPEDIHSMTPQEIENYLTDKRLQSTFVLHMQQGSWLDDTGRWRLMYRSPASLTHILPSEPLMDGAYVFSLPDHSGIWKVRVDNNVVWASSNPIAEPKNYFLWLTSSQYRKSMGLDDPNGCLSVYEGSGPRDSLKTLVWQACWDGFKERGVVFAMLTDGGAFQIRTRTDYTCHPNAITSSRNSKSLFAGSRASNGMGSEDNESELLWSSSQSNFPSMDFAVAVTSHGQVVVLSRTSVDLLTEVIHVVENIQSVKCHPRFLLGQVPDTSLLEMKQKCIETPKCMSFQLAVVEHSMIGEMCAAPTVLKSKNSTNYEGNGQLVTVGRKLSRFDTDSVWIRVDKYSGSCATLDMEGRRTVSMESDARQMCLSEPACGFVVLTSGEASNDFNVMMCRGLPVIGRSAELNRLALVKRTLLSRDTSVRAGLMCTIGWTESSQAHCKQHTRVWERIVQRIHRCKKRPNKEILVK